MKRGRKSTAETSVATLVKSVEVTDRIAAPVTLTDAERDVWLQVVNDQPANFFTPTHAPLLEMYCRHVVQSRVISDEILNFDQTWMARDDGLFRYEKLLSMQEKQSRAASSLATRLRITKQAIDQQTVARSIINAPTAKKPWEI